MSCPIASLVHPSRSNIQLSLQSSLKNPLTRMPTSTPSYTPLTPLPDRMCPVKGAANNYSAPSHQHVLCVHPLVLAPVLIPRHLSVVCPAISSRRQHLAPTTRTPTSTHIHTTGVKRQVYLPWVRQRITRAKGEGVLDVVIRDTSPPSPAYCFYKPGAFLIAAT